MLFIDFTEACDSTDRNQLFIALGHYRIPEKIITLIKMTSDDRQYIQSTHSKYQQQDF
jgi:hypothetical protein